MPGQSLNAATEAKSYQLLILVPRNLGVEIGALRRRLFPRGRYVYTGSARRGMESRIRRHLATGKRLHWHIDYLLAAPGVRIAGVERHGAEECALNRSSPGESIIAGFGVSDCRSGCGSHLKYLGSI